MSSDSAPTDAGARPLVACSRLTKSYTAGNRTIEILHGISIEVPDGEMCAVMGPSGSGKSTLLYCLAGLEQATSGTVGLLGRDVAQQSRADLAKLRRTDVGFVFQSYNLIPTLSAYENVALPYRLGKRTPPADEIRTILTDLGLQNQIESQPPQLSGGEQQRVALARVLVQKPAIVFADEPTGALDTGTGRFVLDQLVAMAHQPGRCVLTVTHDPRVAAACDRVIVLRDGLVVDELRTPTADHVTAVLAGLAGGPRP
jgi:putative ABC transport system ATP-binding protein